MPSSQGDIRQAIIQVLIREKAPMLPQVCTRLGLEDGTEGEAFSNKTHYVRKRLAGKDADYLRNIALRIVDEYPAADVPTILLDFATRTRHAISDINRRAIVESLILKGNIWGKADFMDFLKRVWSLSEMASEDPRFDTAEGDIWQHIVNNDDWSLEYLFFDRLNLLRASDELFFSFLEATTHPRVRDEADQQAWVDDINRLLTRDGYVLAQCDALSGFPIFRVMSQQSGVSGQVKNIIFAANGPKPQIILSDALNNDIAIIANGEYCLVFDEPIPETGLRFSDMLAWWQKSHAEDDLQKLRSSLYQRLYQSLQSVPEKQVLDIFYRRLHKAYGDDVPALIPQVYLHYDPYTIRQNGGLARLLHQRMDFLIIFSPSERVVIEIDGKQHYSDDDEKASPSKYADMVKADRELTLLGYDVYRFGGQEFVNLDAETVIDFFQQLFAKHGVRKLAA